MTGLADQIRSWLPRAHDRLSAPPAAPVPERIGTTVMAGEHVATVAGLAGARLNEVVHFEDGSTGLVVNLSGDDLGCVLLSRGSGITAGTMVRETGQVARVPVGEALLGRVVDVRGDPLDDGPAIAARRRDPVDRPAPAIVDRDLVSTPLMTGLLVVDAMIPLGRGQRELIIGDRKTGKTAIAIDAIINQRDSDVICVYAAVGQKTSTVARAVAAVRAHGAMERCVFVVGAADGPAGAQWLAPYAACSIAEYFRDQGRDALLVIDDLSKHASVYREISLLLRQPPGREAYPGDIFYVHARLLERAAKLSARLGGGSLTALPIAETQGGNLTAYIPTNLISITDGQIYVEPKLFHEGQRPAVNVGRSVSRVGGKTQASAMRRLSESLRLEYAQFLELEVFARFGAMVDARSRRIIEHGRRIRGVLTQPEHHTWSMAVQVALLVALTEGVLDPLTLDGLEAFKVRLPEALGERCPRAAERIVATGELSDEDRKALLSAMQALTSSVAGTPP